MINKMSLLAFSVFLMSIIGCQSSSQKDCAELNWRSEGESIAFNGQTLQQPLEELSLRCKKYKTEAEAKVFVEGYQRGLAKLCNVQNGYDFGASGKEYQGTCPEFRRSHFLKGFYKGRLEFLDAKLKTIESLYNSSEERVWRKEREYTIIQSQDPERAKLEADVLESYREEARSLASQSVKLKREIVKTKKLSAESFF